MTKPAAISHPIITLSEYFLNGFLKRVRGSLIAAKLILTHSPELDSSNQITNS